jgi:hypothetical protein
LNRKGAKDAKVFSCWFILILEERGMGDVLYIYTFEVTFEPQRREGPQYHLSELRGRREGVSFVGSF